MNKQYLLIVLVTSFASLSVAAASVPDDNVIEEVFLRQSVESDTEEEEPLDLQHTHMADLENARKVNLPASYAMVLASMKTEAQSCKKSERYRRADGTCNNLDNPLWGAGLHYQQRLLPNAYQDGVGIPRLVGKKKSYLPSSRKVSVNCFPPNKETSQYLDPDTTQMSMQWGQYIDHDIVKTDVNPGSACCGNPDFGCVHVDALTGGPCFPITIEDGDRYFNTSCMSFKRSFTVNINGVNEQISGVTSFVDASTVYGSYQGLQNKLRTFVDGKLKLEDDNTLPLGDGFKCRKEFSHGGSSGCPMAGDARVNVFAGLTLLHLLFVREHNRLAGKLKHTNPHWDDERLFQETRKIIIAIHQKITYDEFLPHVVGPAAMKFFGLHSGNYVYDPKTDPSVINEFAGAAFRYGHSQINSFLTNNHTRTAISKLFFRPGMTTHSETQMMSVIKEQCSKKAQKTNQFFSTEVTDKLFLGVDVAGMSTDLAARNIQRGRDHGLNPYQAYFNLSISQFGGINGLDGDEASIDCLSYSGYESIEDVDLFVGALHEKPLEGALLGPTFAYIVGEQFRRLKYGDQFFYETNDKTKGFTKGQLNEINKLSLSHVFCRCYKVKALPKNMFATFNGDKNKNVPISCAKLRDIDLTFWKDGEVESESQGESSLHNQHDSVEAPFPEPSADPPTDHPVEFWENMIELIENKEKK